MKDSINQKLQILSNKVDSLNAKMSLLSDKTTFSIWIPIIAALITAVLGTIIAQALDRIFKNINDLNKEKREIRSKCVNIKIRLRGLFRQLATSECDSAQWYFIYKTDFENNDYAYPEHLRCETESKETLKTIDVTMAEFLAEVSKYEKLNGKKFNVDIEISEIENLIFPNKDYYEETIDAKLLINEIAPREKKILKDRYLENLKPFISIIIKMI